MYIKVKARPGAKQEEFKKISKDHFNICVREKAERNLANKKILDLIARHFKIPANKVRIINGHHSRSKILSVDVE